MIIDHNSKEYQKHLKEMVRYKNQYNGARYYSEEIVKNIIPLVKTDRDWITVNIPRPGTSHLIVFVHNNLKPRLYEWVKTCSDVILVCGIKETAEKLQKYGKTIYLPLSVDVKEVKKYRVKEKTKGFALIGRPEKLEEKKPKGNYDIIGGLSREKFLQEIAQYEYVYAVGRCAIEAKILGCEILPYDSRFPDPEIWKIVDNRKAAKILQKELNKIDGKQKKYFTNTFNKLSSFIRGENGNNN